jgi:hypothetical protein
MPTPAQAGTTVPVAWSFAADAAPGFGEMELILSLDGGRSFPIRVTRDLDPRTFALAWRVPALPTGQARLALRAGDGEEPDNETILLVSEGFSIEADPGLPLEATFVERGEWRLREALDGKDAARIPAPPSLGDGAPAMTTARELPASAAPRREPLPAPACHRSAPDFEAIPLPALGSRVTPEPARPQAPKRE